MNARQLTPQQEAEADLLAKKIEHRIKDKIREIARDAVATPDHELLGSGEFALRDHVHEIAATILETHINDRKKGVPKC